MVLLWDSSAIATSVPTGEPKSVASMSKFTRILEKVLGAFLWIWTTIAVVIFAALCSIVWVPIMILVYLDERFVEGRKAKDIIDVEVEVKE